MLIDLVVTTFLGLLTGLLGLLPFGSWSFDLSPAFGIMESLDAWLPMHEALTASAAAAGVIAAVFAFGLLRQVWKFVPFVGGG